MGCSIVVRENGKEEEVIPLAGSQEINSLWRPIIDKHALGLLDYCLTAGLAVELDTYDQLSKEIDILLSECKSTLGFDGGGSSPVVRIERLRQVLAKAHPFSHVYVYVG